MSWGAFFRRGARVLVVIALWSMVFNSTFEQLVGEPNWMGLPEWLHYFLAGCWIVTSFWIIWLGAREWERSQS